MPGQYLEREAGEGISKGLAKQGVTHTSPTERGWRSLHKACIPRTERNKAEQTGQVARRSMAQSLDYVVWK